MRVRTLQPSLLTELPVFSRWFQYFLQAFHRVVCLRSNLYDVFSNIRDDELEHVKTMVACEDNSISVDIWVRTQSEAVAKGHSVYLFPAEPLHSLFLPVVCLVCIVVLLTSYRRRSGRVKMRTGPSSPATLPEHLTQLGSLYYDTWAHGESARTSWWQIGGDAAFVNEHGTCKCE